MNAERLMAKLQEALELAGKATAGPWGYDLNGFIARHESGEWEETVAMIPGTLSKQAHSDGEFLAAARTLVPVFATALLKLLEETPYDHDAICQARREYYTTAPCRCGYEHWQAAIAEAERGLCGGADVSQG